MKHNIADYCLWPSLSILILTFSFVMGRDTYLKSNREHESILSAQIEIMALKQRIEEIQQEHRSQLIINHFKNNQQ